MLKVMKEVMGEHDGQAVYSFTMVNNAGMEVTVLNYGCIITKIMVPDKNGHEENVVIGHDSLEGYVQDRAFLGAVVGRVGGRIQGGAFELDGRRYTLAQNNGSNHLHGGIKGFNKVVWNAEEVENGVQFTYLSRDGEEGYPGNLHVQVTYTLDEENQLRIQYEAETDKKTILTLTNHSYFNLSGNLKADILQHSLQLKSDQFLELNEEFIPTGTRLNVEHTPFDFREGSRIEAGTVSKHPQNVLVGHGYDHPFLLNEHHNEEIMLRDPVSGRKLTVETDEVGVVVYSGNSLGSTTTFRGTQACSYLGICLETQALPDAIHHDDFPSTVLDNGETYSSTTVYRFDVE